MKQKFPPLFHFCVQSFSSPASSFHLISVSWLLTYLLVSSSLRFYFCLFLSFFPSRSFHSRLNSTLAFPFAVYCRIYRFFLSPTVFTPPLSYSLSVFPPVTVFTALSLCSLSSLHFLSNHCFHFLLSPVTAFTVSSLQSLLRFFTPLLPRVSCVFFSYCRSSSPCRLVLDHHLPPSPLKDKNHLE